jgi:hypothetical protein
MPKWVGYKDLELSHCIKEYVKSFSSSGVSYNALYNSPHGQFPVGYIQKETWIGSKGCLMMPSNAAMISRMLQALGV